MAVDLYAPCPCGSGKKLKFCCSDLAPEIEKVQRMLEGDQPRAALGHLEATLSKAKSTKVQGRASLLDLKGAIELSIGEHTAAASTVAEYLRIDPENASAHAQAALAAAAEATNATQDEQANEGSPVRRAVDHLQAALERVSDQIPARVLQAIGAVGQALLAAGDLTAARAHLWLYQGVAGEEDTRAMELLVRLNQVGGLPLLLRDSLFLREAPEGHACETEHDDAQLLASRGQWRRTRVALEKLCEQHPSLPILRYNAAVAAGWLGDQEAFVAGLREFARQTAEQAGGLPDDAVEAESIAQLLDPVRREPRVEVARTAFPVENEETLIDRFTRDARVAAHQMSETELAALEGPRPRSVWLLLDRPLPETGVGLTADATPRIAGMLSHFGRQTDREERVELVADQDDRHAEALALVAEVAGDAIGPAGDAEALGQSASGDSLFNARWRFPDDTPVADRRRLMAEEQRRALLEEWPDKPRVVLDDKTPQQVSQDSAYALPLTAALLVLEQSAGSAVEPTVFAELREKLGVAPAEPIDLAVTDAEVMPLARVPRADLSAASDGALLALYKRAELSGANEAALPVAREAIKRPGLAEAIPPEELYSRLAALEPDLGEAIGWIERGRELAQESGGSGAVWDLAELELRVVEGQFDEANALVQNLRDNHLTEPGIAERLYRLLYALGAVPAPGAAPEMPAEPAPMAEPAGGGSGLWTPGSEEPASGGGQKIWTPD